MTDPTEMACNELVELVSEYLDGALDEATRSRVEEHLAECDGCTNYLQQFRSTIDTLSGVSEERLDPAFRDRLMAAFSTWK